MLGFVVSIALSALGLVSLFKSLLLFLGILLLTNTLKPNEILQRLPTQIWLIISSALLLSYALTNTQAIDLLSQVIANNQQSFTPFVALCVIYLATWWLTELVTNNAAAALVFPIAIGLAQSLAIDPTGYIMAVAFGASASFFSPYGYQTNLMVYNAGQYRIMDFVRVGLPVSVVYGTITVAAITLVYGY